MDELQAESIRRAEADEKAEAEPVEEEPSKVYMLPSVAAAMEAGTYIEEVKPKARVVSEECYTRMVDRELFERIQRSKGGEKFTQLYNGISVTGNEEKERIFAHDAACHIYGRQRAGHAPVPFVCAVPQRKAERAL